MPRFPDSDLELLDRYKEGGSSAVAMDRYDGLELHTAVSDAVTLFGSMNVPGTPSSHCYVNEFGRTKWYIDTKFRSSATLEGNHRLITVETWDGGLANWPNGICPPWNDAQLDTLVDIYIWAHQVHGIPLQLMQSSLPTEKGLGWHRLGIDGDFPSGILGGRVAGGELWSSSRGKSCPTDKRILQCRDIILPRAIEGIKMPLTQEDKDWLTNNLGKVVSPVDPDSKWSLTTMLGSIYNRTKPIDVNALATAVAAKLDVTNLTQEQIKTAVKDGVKEVLREGVA